MVPATSPRRGSPCECVERLEARGRRTDELENGSGSDDEPRVAEERRRIVDGEHADQVARRREVPKACWSVITRDSERPVEIEREDEGAQSEFP
jgi:hypothetical protein